jgi:polar amino acid transport system permease protein
MIVSPDVQASLPVLADGLLNTVLLCLMALVVSALAGHVGLALRIGKWAPLRALGWLYVSLMRGTPALVQLFVLFFTLPLLGLGGRPMLAAVLAIGLNSGAYVAEVLRGNLSVVGSGQREAAQALGLGPVRIWVRISGPQIWRAAMPALVNEFTILLKTTPLASVVGVTELAFAGQMVSARTFQASEVLMLVSMCYLVLILPVIALARTLERKLHGLGAELPLGAH